MIKLFLALSESEITRSHLGLHYLVAHVFWKVEQPLVLVVTAQGHLAELEHAVEVGGGKDEEAGVGEGAVAFGCHLHLSTRSAEV